MGYETTLTTGKSNGEASQQFSEIHIPAYYKGIFLDSSSYH